MSTPCLASRPGRSLRIALLLCIVLGVWTGTASAQQYQCFVQYTVPAPAGDFVFADAYVSADLSGGWWWMPPTEGGGYEIPPCAIDVWSIDPMLELKAPDGHANEGYGVGQGGEYGLSWHAWTWLPFWGRYGWWTTSVWVNYVRYLGGEMGGSYEVQVFEPEYFPIYASISAAANVWQPFRYQQGIYAWANADQPDVNWGEFWWDGDCAMQEEHRLCIFDTSVVGLRTGTVHHGAVPYPPSVTIEVIQPVVTLTASDLAPAVNQANVFVWADLTPGEAYTSLIWWSGPCTPDPAENRRCFVHTSTPGSKDIFASYADDGGMMLQVNVQASVNVTAMGFSNDIPLGRWSSGGTIDVNDGTEPTWTAAGTRDPVAYPYSTRPTAFIDISISPAITNSTMVAIRGRSGATVLTMNAGVQISGTTQRIAMPAFQSALMNGVGRGDYTWIWEVSFDSGGSWLPMGTTSGQRIYWTLAAPQVPRFKDTDVQTLDPVWDEALRRVTDAVASPITSPTALAQLLAADIDARVVYDPEAAPLMTPLDAYANPAGCKDHALLLRGLLANAGVQATALYLWGGDVTTKARWVYKFRSNLAAFQGFVTMRMTRPYDAAERYHQNPHFSFHAVVVIGGGSSTYFDSSFGDWYAPTAMPVDETRMSATSDDFRSGPDSLASIVSSSVWSEYDTAPRVPADLADQKFCPHDILPAQFAAFVDQIVPTNLVAGQTFTYQVRFRNTGPDKWHTVAPPSTSTAHYAAVPQPIGSMTFGFNVMFLPQGTIIRPGEIFTINGQGTAPGVPGQYNFQLRMYQNGFGQFGAPSDNVVVTVSPP